MTSETVQETIAAYFAATRAMDAEAWVATFAEDAVSYEPSGALQGHDAFRAFFAGIVGAFETVGLTEEEVFIVGNEAAVKWRGEGKGKNGRSVSFEGIDLFTINDAGKIQTIKAYWNPAAMMAELMG